MNSAANDNRIETVERKLQILAYQIEKMESEVLGADGERKNALLKLIRLGQERIAELRTLH